MEYQVDRSRRLKKTLLIEQARLDQLIIQHIQLRERLQPFHNGCGWETEAFLSYTGLIINHHRFFSLLLLVIYLGSMSGTIRISQISEVLENWIIPFGLIGIQPIEPKSSRKESESHRSNEIAASSITELIEIGLKKMKYGHKIELNYEEFLLFCEYILSCQQVQLNR